MCARYGFNIFYLNILWMLDVYSIAKVQFLPVEQSSIDKSSFYMRIFL